MATVYTINKGVSRPIMFRGLKAQYIGYLAVGLVLLLLLFAILYILHIGLIIILPLILAAGGGLFTGTQALSRRFGEHGLDKYLARRKLPRTLRFRTRKLFTDLAKPDIQNANDHA